MTISENDDLPYSLYSPGIVVATFDELKVIPHMEETTFTFAHIIKPHQPILFDRNGNNISVNFGQDDVRDTEFFFEQLHYINSKVLDMLDYMLA